MLPRLRDAKNILRNPLEVWNSVPYDRRASVLALLYNDPRGELGCLLTVRSKSISYGGDMALPGGKAENNEETPTMTSIREAQEELGLSGPVVQSLDVVLNLPAYLSSRFHCVVPTVAFLKDWHKWDRVHNIPDGVVGNVSREEVSAVLGVNLKSLLSTHNYHSKIMNWNGLKFHQHFFTKTVPTKKVGEPGQYQLWGLTANILIDIARLAYGREPPFPHRRPMEAGDQNLIEELIKKGKFLNKESVNFKKIWGPTSPILNSRSPT